MSLSYNYFIMQRYKLLYECKEALKKMLERNNAKSNVDEWNSIVKNQYNSLERIFNHEDIKALTKASESKKQLCEFFDRHDFQFKINLDRIMDETSSFNPGIFEVEVINSVIDFASNCKTVEDLNRIWNLPKISEHLDYNNPNNDYNQFMGECTDERLEECLKIKNANPVYSSCYIMAKNHYDDDVGFLYFVPEIKTKIDSFVAKAAKYVALEYKEILENGEGK